MCQLEWKVKSCINVLCSSKKEGGARKEKRNGGKERKRKEKRKKRKEKEKKGRKRKKDSGFFLSSLAFQRSELIGRRSKVWRFDERLQFKR